jgi:hypothetical protein
MRDATFRDEECIDADSCYTFSSGRWDGRRGRLCLARLCLPTRHACLIHWLVSDTRLKRSTCLHICMLPWAVGPPCSASTFVVAWDSSKVRRGSHGRSAWESRFAHCAAYASQSKQQGVDLQGPFSGNRTLCNTAQSSRRPRNIFIIDIDRNRKQRRIDRGILNLDNSGRSAVYHLCRHGGPLQPLRDIAFSPRHRYLILHHSSNFSRARSCSLETCLNHILGFEQRLA